MGAIAAKKALEKAGCSAEDVDLILVATMTPDQPLPSTASLLQSKLENCHAPAMDISAACSGYLYALSVAKAYIESGMYRCVLVVGCEKMSQVVDHNDRSTIILFGDGAGASVVQASGPGLRIEKIKLGLDTKLSHALYIPNEGKMCMSGQEIFKTAIQKGTDLVTQLLIEHKLSSDQIDAFIFHQANLRIIQNLQKKFNIPDEKIPLSIQYTANTSAASIPIILEGLNGKKDQIYLSVAFGAGFTYSGAIFKSV
jgi:3-oxoacyl-[acyl-carrier-protein] synthase-3